MRKRTLATGLGRAEYVGFRSERNVLSVGRYGHKTRSPTMSHEP